MQRLELALFAVEETQRLGAASSEAYILDANSLTIEVSDNRLETLKLAKDTGIGLRVVSQDGSMGFAYSTIIDKEEIKRLAGEALNNSRKSFTDVHYRFPAPAKLNRQMELLDPQLDRMPVEAKIEMAREMEQSAKSFDTRIAKSERCLYQDAQYGVTIANSNGLADAYRAGYCGLYGSVLASSGNDIQSGMALSYRRRLNDLDPRNIGREAAQQAVLLLGAKSVKTTRTPVILSPYVSVNFLSLLIPSFSADAVHKGKSMFGGRIGEKIVSSNLSIIDDGTGQAAAVEVFGSAGKTGTAETGRKGANGKGINHAWFAV